MKFGSTFYCIMTPSVEPFGKKKSYEAVAGTDE